MAEPEGQQRRDPPDRDDGELIQFGGLPARWPFGEIHLPRLPNAPPALSGRFVIALTAVASALLIGFFGGRLTAHQAGHKPRSEQPVSPPAVIQQSAATVIGLTGARCATQVGNDLDLGVEISNQTRGAITLGPIRPMFPLGGLRAVSSGVGTCGALPPVQMPSSPSLAPGATEWIHTTIAVRYTCPEPLPVWFRVRYASARQTGTAVLVAFPDLGPVSYRHCSAAQNASSFVAIVELGAGHSSRG